MTQAPIFKSVFGAHWDQLPKVLKRHYANRPYSSDQTIVEGRLDVTCRGPLRLLRPVYRFLGAIPAVNENNVPVTVRFDSAPDTAAFHFDRLFRFRNDPPYMFRSRMLQTGAGEVIEIMRFGICWRAHFAWADGRVTMTHRGYGLWIFGHLLPLPITLLIGRGDAMETAVDDDHFDMAMTITHPLFGVVYGYAGRFAVTLDP